MAVSQHDGKLNLVDVYHRGPPLAWAEVAEQPVNDTVDPDLKVRIPVSVRNLGNDCERELGGSSSPCQ